MTTQTPETPTRFAPEVRMHHATRAKASRLSSLLEAEYPGLALHARHDEDGDGDHDGTLTAFAVLTADGEVEVLVTDGPRVPELADVLDACMAAEIDPAGEEEEEEARGGSVVPETYRALYKLASSNGQSCGDWLAEQLVADTTGADGKLDVDHLTSIFEANRLDMRAKWALMRFSGSRGWEGRYRMSGRVVLEKTVLLSGEYHVPGAVIVPPADWIARMTTKHEKWLAKARKQQAAQDAVSDAVLA